MAGQNQRLNVVPTVIMLGVMKARLVAATRGYALLKKKRIVLTEESIGDIMKSSSFVLIEAKYIAGENIKHTVLENVQNASFKQCRVAYIKAIEVLVELDSLQTPFLTLDEAIKTTNRRVNALENVVKPMLENTITYIKGKLDELEREDFFLLKKIQDDKPKIEESVINLT
ncbi:hypothetical protein UlMin_006480 [Ulmus minor]